MGGIFAEGIDLKNDRLIGAIIVGTGLPQVSNEREILKNYYDGKGLSGFDYAFRYPGMNKVLQAALALMPMTMPAYTFSPGPINSVPRSCAENRP